MRVGRVVQAASSDYATAPLSGRTGKHSAIHSALSMEGSGNPSSPSRVLSGDNVSPRLQGPPGMHVPRPHPPPLQAQIPAPSGMSEGSTGMWRPPEEPMPFPPESSEGLVSTDQPKSGIHGSSSERERVSPKMGAAETPPGMRGWPGGRRTAPSAIRPPSGEGASGSGGRGHVRTRSRPRSGPTPRSAVLGGPSSMLSDGSRFDAGFSDLYMQAGNVSADGASSGFPGHSRKHGGSSESAAAAGTPVSSAVPTVAAPRVVPLSPQGYRPNRRAPTVQEVLPAGPRSWLRPASSGTGSARNVGGIMSRSAYGMQSGPITPDSLAEDTAASSALSHVRIPTLPCLPAAQMVLLPTCSIQWYCPRRRVWSDAAK